MARLLRVGPGDQGFGVPLGFGLVLGSGPVLGSGSGFGGFGLLTGGFGLVVPPGFGLPVPGSGLGVVGFGGCGSSLTVVVVVVPSALVTVVTRTRCVVVVGAALLSTDSGVELGASEEDSVDSGAEDDVDTLPVGGVSSCTPMGVVASSLDEGPAIAATAPKMVATTTPDAASSRCGDRRRARELCSGAGDS
ncbi:MULTISPECIES: hypothetical protein [Actinosynnema]|uniref:hypothetical protein n=1 Tax=Actinosynnema TaxID=40566 RepID=UPI0020A25105|nr:hypothetical protein [Actinosynnema pretiosum]MCP2093932.1 hypothetical protein [Actinosynnema pretiosum]